MRIAFLGDVNGRAGRHILATQLPRLVAGRAIDFVVANVENAATGSASHPTSARSFWPAASIA